MGSRCLKEDLNVFILGQGCVWLWIEFEMGQGFSRIQDTIGLPIEPSALHLSRSLSPNMETAVGPRREIRSPAKGDCCLRLQDRMQ